MQETIKKHEQIDPPTPLQTAASQGGTAIQLGLSFLLAQLHGQQFYTLLIALVAADICGLLCTLNLQYSLYLLELTLSRLAHGQPRSERNNDNYRKYFVRRWPLGPLFLRLQETEQCIQHYATNEHLTTELREKALQQVSEAAAQAERNRIARELHDSIKQQIFSMSVSAAAAKALWQGENSEDAREAVEDIQHTAKEAQVEMQALLQQLRPAPLENTSLVEALHIQAQALGFRTGAQMHVDLGALPENDRLLPGTQEVIFRLVQEAFANIAKHARARTIWLALHTTGQALRIEVRDDGQGFDTAKVRTGAIGYVCKEADPEILLSSIRAAARGQSLLDPAVASAVMQELMRGGKHSVELTEREQEVLRQLALGRTNHEIAEALTVSDETVKTHVGNILTKLQLAHRTQAVIYALKKGIISLDEIELP